MKSIIIIIAQGLDHADVVCLQVAVLDVDICGPSIPKLMGLEGEQVHQSGSGWSPVVSLCTFCYPRVAFGHCIVLWCMLCAPYF